MNMSHSAEPPQMEEHARELKTQTLASGLSEGSDKTKAHTHNGNKNICILQPRRAVGRAVANKWARIKSCFHGQSFGEESNSLRWKRDRARWISFY